MSLKLIIILFLSATCSVICGNEYSDEGKYIDSLPAAQKKEILENIARRILDEVKSKETDLKSGELPDSQLDKHTNYVDKVLREEKERFSKNHNLTMLNRPMLRTTDEKNLHTLGKKHKEGKNKQDLQINKTVTHTTLVTPGTQLHSHEVKIDSKSDDDKNGNYTIEITIEDSKENNGKRSQNIEQQIPVTIEYASKKPELDKAKFEKSENVNTRKYTNVTVAQTVRINDISDVGTTEKSGKRRKFKVVRRSSNIISNNNPSDNNVNNFGSDDIPPSTLKLYTLRDEKIELSYTTVQTTTPIIKEDSMLSSSTVNQKEEFNSTQIDTPNNITKKYNEKNENTGIKSQTASNSNYSLIGNNETTIAGQTVTETNELTNINESNVDKAATVAITENALVTLIISSIINVNNHDSPSSVLNTTKKAKPKKKHVVSTTTAVVKETSNTTIAPTENVTEMPTEPKTTSSIGKDTLKLSTEIVPLTETPIKANIDEDMTVSTVAAAYKNPTRTPDISKKTRTIIAEMTETENEQTTYINSPSVLRNLNSELNPENLEEFSLNDDNYNFNENDRGDLKNLDDNEITDSKLFKELQQKFNTKNNVKEYKVYEVNNEEDVMKIINGKILKFDHVKPKSSDKKSIIDDTNIISGDDINLNNDVNLNPVEIISNPNDKPQKNTDNDVLRSLIEGLQEQPYYIPVYNYAPENAYFSAYNKFGPNFQDGRRKFQINIDLDTMDSKEKSNRNLLKARKPKKFSYLNIPSLAQLIAKPNYHTIDTPEKYDYENSFFDAGLERVGDYLISRSGRKRKKYLMPNSNEYDHPVNWIKSGTFNSYTGAVRHNLIKSGYHVSMDRYLPTTTTTEEPVTENNRKKKRKKKYLRDNINETVNNLIARLSADNEDDEKVIKKPQHKKQKLVGLDYLWNRTPKEKNKPKVTNKESIVKTKDNLLELKASLDYIGDIVEDYLRNDEEKDDEEPVVDKPHLQMLVNMSDGNDIVPLVLSLQTLMRSKESNLDSYITVLKDQVKIDSQVLENYDWLATAVDIQAALTKLQNLTLAIKRGTDNIPSEDLELYYYIVYLFSDAKLKHIEENKVVRAKQAVLREINEKLKQSNVKPNQNTQRPKNNNERPKLNKGRWQKFLTKMKSHHKPHSFEPMGGLKEEDELFKISDLRRDNIQELVPLIDFKVDYTAKDYLKRDVFENKVIEFGKFLADVETLMYDLHNAIKHVALISKNKTALFKNFKELYLTNLKDKEAMRLLLHLQLIKVLEMVEDSSNKGLNKDYLAYIDSNAEDVKNTTDEMLIVLKLVNQMKELK